MSPKEAPRPLVIGTLVLGLLHGLVFLVIGLLAFLIPPRIVQEAYPLSLGPPLDWNSSAVRSASFDNPPYLSGDMLLSEEGGRMQSLESLDFLGCYVWFCEVPLPPSPVTTAFVKGNCRMVSVVPNDFPAASVASFQGGLTYQGSYNFNCSNVSAATSIAVAHPTKDRILGAATLVSSPFAVNISTGNSLTVVGNPAAIGAAYNAAQYFLYITLFILFVTWLSMVLVWHSRHLQTITLILMACIFANVFVVALQASGTLIQSSRLCFALGFFQQFTACSMLSFYCLSTVHFAAIFFGNGRFTRFMFREAWPWYLVIGFTFPLVDCCIVLGLIPLNLSFGIMYPWRYCWIRTESSVQVLAISFYLPALLVIAFNLVVSLCICVHILRLRKVRGKVDHETVRAVAALFFSTNLGTCGFG